MSGVALPKIGEPLTGTQRRNAGSFCREHRSWFCPCVASWRYAEAPSVARAWFEPGHENESGKGSDGANQAELDWDDGEQGTLW